MSIPSTLNHLFYIASPKIGHPGSRSTFLPGTLRAARAAGSQTRLGFRVSGNDIAITGSEFLKKDVGKKVADYDAEPAIPCMTLTCFFADQGSRILINPHGKLEIKEPL